MANVSANRKAGFTLLSYALGSQPQSSRVLSFPSNIAWLKVAEVEGVEMEWNSPVSVRCCQPIASSCSLQGGSGEYENSLTPNEHSHVCMTYSLLTKKVFSSVS